MNFFDQKYLRNHLPQLCPKVVKHTFIYTYIHSIQCTQIKQTLYSTFRSCIFCDIMPCSPLKSTNISDERHVHLLNSRMNQVRKKHEAGGTLVWRWWCSSKMLAAFLWTTHRYIPGETILHDHCREPQILYTISCYVLMINLSVCTNSPHNINKMIRVSLSNTSFS
jgi:hypothetical protein